MKDRGKGVAQLAFPGGDPFSFPCRDHPRSSNVGVCAFCLKDRLLNLVCSECGEQRLSSCSCSEDLSSNRNSCAHDAGSVGRVSFLLDNEKQGEGQSSTVHGPRKPEDPVVLRRRSSSSCTESRRSGIWRVGKLFLQGKKKKKKETTTEENRGGGGDQGQSEVWLFKEAPMSRSRSSRSFRGGDNWNFARGRSLSVHRNPGLVDSDRKSCFSEAEMRRSGLSDAEIRKSCFSETDARKSGVLDPEEPRLNRRVFSMRESDYFGEMDETNFIDLRFCTAKGSGAVDLPGNGESELRSGLCKVTARDRMEMKKKKSKSFMGWRWGVSRHHPSTLT